MAEIVRTRTFEPHDVENRSVEDIKARIDELKAKRDSFDPETHHTGLQRLGSSYTIAEPFAFFDGPSHDQLKLNRYIVYGGMSVITVLTSIIGGKIAGSKYSTNVVRGLLCTPFVAYFGGRFYEWQVQRLKKRQNVLFHYALLHEKDFPIIERKKYGEIIKDWPPKRSLNVLGQK